MDCAKKKGWQLRNLPALIYLSLRCYMSRSHRSVVDADVIDQAGEEGVCVEVLVCSNLQSAQQLARLICVKRDFYAINV